MKLYIVICLILVALAAVAEAWLFKARSRDETGHRTGLGTIAKSFIRNPIKTIKTGRASLRNSHERKIGDSKLASAFNALKETIKFPESPDETGHRTGLGTIGKSFIRNPIKTIKTGDAFVRNYIDMWKKNTIGYDKIAHERANYEGTKTGGSKLAAAFSAVREYSKVLPGDRRSQEEIDSDMDANRRGRERAINELAKIETTGKPNDN